MAASLPLPSKSGVRADNAASKPAHSPSPVVQPSSAANSNSRAAVVSANSTSPSPKTSTASTPILCQHFEGQVFRKNRCKTCLRDKSEHNNGTPTTTTATSAAPSAAPSAASPVSASPYSKSQPQLTGHPPPTKSKEEAPTASISGILKKAQNGGLTAPNQPPPLPAPAMTSSSNLRPVRVAVSATAETDRPGHSPDQEQLNTTTQTIILSKHSPQIRRSSSSEATQRGAHVRGVRRFSSAEKVSEQEEEGDDSDRMRTPLSGSLLSMVTAVESTSDLQSMHTAVSAGSLTSLNSAGTYTSSRDNFQDTVEEMQATIRSLTAQLDDKSIALAELEAANGELREQLSSPLQSGNNAAGGTLTRKRDEQKRLRDLEREKAELAGSVKMLQDEVERIREAMDEVNDPDEAAQPLGERVRDAVHKLQSAEMMCEDLMDDNEELKKELRSMEAEMDELHDNFRQDQAVEFQTIQKEMEQTMKNCRILQFKLRKAERKCDELEADKAIYEVKLRQLTNVTPVTVAGGASASQEAAYAQEMAAELRQVVEVNKRLHEEIERIEEERGQLRLEYEALTKSCAQMDKHKDAYRLAPAVHQPHSQSGLESDSPSHSSGAQILSQASGSNGKSIQRNGTAVPDTANQEYDVNQLLRDLYDSVERETDLRDQLTFAEEQARRLRGQLTDTEHENDSLQHQLKKLSAARPPSGDYSKLAAPEQLDILQINEDMKIQLDVAEHEVSLLKRKLQEADQKNEDLGVEVKRLRSSCDELKSAKETMSAALNNSTHRGGDSTPVSQEQKVKVMEAECNELRRKLVDKERQLERLSSQVELVKRRSTLDRSRSLEDGQLIDLRRQLTMAEQEISVLRQKTHGLESDNDRLSVENKRLHFGVRAASAAGNHSSNSKRGSTEDPDVARAVKSSEALASISEQFTDKYLADITALSAAGKSAQELLEEIAGLKQRNEEIQAAIGNARDAYEKILAKAPIKKDIATRQELKSRIDELEADMKFALTVAEQEGSAAKRLQTEVEELRAKVRRVEMQDAPVSDEVKEYRIKLYDAQHEVDNLKVEIKDLQTNLVEERRRSRTSESDIIAKERMDTQLRNLKQELAKQRYMVEELTAKDNTLCKQLAEWQKKYHSLKDAYKSDTDAWQKELTDLEQELSKEKGLRTNETGSKKTLEKELQQARNKNATYEDQIRNLIEAGKLKGKDLRDKNAKLETEVAKDRKALEEVRMQLDNRQAEAAMQDTKKQAEKERLEQRVNNLVKEQEEAAAQSKRESDKLRSEVEKLKKTALETEKALQEAKSEAEKLKTQQGSGDAGTTPKGGYARLSAYERARANEQIKEEVEKLHKQNLELQKQLLDARRAGDEAGEQLQRSERKWTCERDEMQRKLRQDEKIHKAEMSAVSMRFENKQRLLEDESKTLNVALKQVRVERDTLQERLEGVTQHSGRLKDEHADATAKLDIANAQLASLKSNRDSAQRQLDDVQSRLNKLESERNDTKSKAAKEKSSYELKIAELQDKLSQYEGQHAKLSAYALKTRQMAQGGSNSSGTSKKNNGEPAEASDARERAEAAEKAAKRAEKELTDVKAQVLALKLDKERENDLLRAKIRELQDKHKPVSDAHVSLKLAYDCLRTELDVIQIERDDFAERLAENESYQIKERGKIDQILSEIQKLKEVAPSLMSSEEDLFLSSPSAPKRPSRGRTRDTQVDDKAIPFLATTPTSDHKKYKGTKSADLQKAIDNITKVSEDIKAERKTRRPILPHKRSQSASIAESSAGASPLIRRYPSLDDDETGDAVSLPAPTPLKSIAKVSRNPRFPSIPPSFIVTPPTAMQQQQQTRDKLRSRAYELAAAGHSASPITEESFTNPGGSWDSIDSDISTESWNLPLTRPAHDDRLSYISLPNLPQKVDTATSMEDKPKRSLMDVAKAKRKKLMAKLRPLSLHSSTESLEETVRVTHSDSSGFFESPSQPAKPRAPPTPPSLPAHTPSPSELSTRRSPYGSAPATVQSSPNTAARAAPAAKESIPAPTVPDKTRVKEVARERAGGTATTNTTAATSTTATSTAPSSAAASSSTPAASSVKEVKFTEGKAGAGKPYLNVWRKPISDIAKKFENKSK
ncbi:uncharacterized protein LOC129593421 [Paramacrobiotus metropolitanus]|uniref:uncharacterized protein LOC129593421 n=1 Tax=Paramacrobiotus metropolitanus TaxID=2943436 RepID=UPI00244654D7|nr:uncharacterized protein LOC129593421 [Paramacrobiotus metropolitanus]